MMKPPEPDNPHKRRPVWPWALGALVLCLFAAGFSFWWPMYRANELKHRILEQGGAFQYDETSSRWKSIFGERFHPWYHEGFYITLPLEPDEGAYLGDSDLIQISKLRRVDLLSLNVSRNSPAAIRALKNCTDIEGLYLGCNGRSIPTDWMGTLPDLQAIVLMQVEISEDDWRNLVASNAVTLDLQDCSIHTVPVKSGSVETLFLSGGNLNRGLAESISQLPLIRLGLYSCDSNDAFWSKLSAHPTLSDLDVEDTFLNQHAIDEISKLALTDLQLHQNGTTKMSLNQQQVESLGDLLKLESLDFVHVDVPDGNCWMSVAKLPALKTLVANDCKIGDAAMAELAKSRSLETIIVQKTKITDSGLMRLAELKTLKEVYISRTSITDGARIDFNTARPDVELVEPEW